MSNGSKTELFQETIAMNKFKGDPYQIKFKNNPIVFVGIPVPAGEEGKFTFQIQAPQDRKGMVEALVEDIEDMEKK